MIDEGYFGAIDSYPETDILIVISRYYPRWLKPGLMFKPELAPSVALLEDWKARVIDWEAYEKQYREEMNTPKIQRLIIQYGNRVASKQVHRFLCHEKEPPCHRFILKDLIDEAVKKSTSGGCVNCGYYMSWKFSREDMLKRGRERRCSKCGENYDVKNLPTDTLLTYFMGNGKTRR